MLAIKSVLVYINHEVTFMSYGRILAQLRKDKGLTQTEVAEHVSKFSNKVYTNKAISHWEKGSAIPSIEQFLMMCELYGVVDIQATFRDIETGYRNLSRLNALGKGKVEDFIAVLLGNPLFSETENEVEVDETSHSYIKLYDIPAAAGAGFYLDSEAYEEIKVDWTVPVGTDYAIRIGGDSMAPRFIDSQMVFVKEQHNLTIGEIGIFALNRESYIKILGRGELLSINPKYEPIPIKEFDSFYVLGKVLC